MRSQQELTIIINNHTYLDFHRYGYQSVQYGNGVENIESSSPHHMNLKSSSVPLDSDTNIDTYINDK